MKPERKLDEREIALVPELVEMFKERYTGNENAVTTGALITYLASKQHIVCGSSLRRIIGHIRQNDLIHPAFILSDVSIGYWLSSDISEMDAYLDKQLNRMTNQFQNIKSLHQRIRYPQKNGQQIQSQLF